MSEDYEREIVFGVYFHPKKGFAIAEPTTENGNKWKIDKNESKPHPLFRVQMSVVQAGTGNYFFNKTLKGYEYIGEF